MSIMSQGAWDAWQKAHPNADQNWMGSGKNWNEYYNVPQGGSYDVESGQIFGPNNQSTGQVIPQGPINRNPISPSPGITGIPGIMGGGFGGGFGRNSGGWGGIFSNRKLRGMGNMMPQNPIGPSNMVVPINNQGIDLGMGPSPQGPVDPGFNMRPPRANQPKTWGNLFGSGGRYESPWNKPGGFVPISNRSGA